jgi:hypothetical protein
MPLVAAAVVEVQADIPAQAVAVVEPVGVQVDIPAQAVAVEPVGVQADIPAQAAAPVAAVVGEEEAQAAERQQLPGLLLVAGY